MSNFKRKIAANIGVNEARSEKFSRIFFTTLSEVVFADELEKSVSSIASGIMHAFDADSFIFRRRDELAELVAFSVRETEKLLNLLRKAGLELDVHNIKLSEERTRVFDSVYTEFDNLFPLIGDMTTSAACRKIQHELGFHSLASASVKTEAGDYAILVLLPEKTRDAERDLSQFVLLVKSAIYLSNLKNRLRGFEDNFDEQFIRSKNELIEKEGTHLFLFDGMPIAAAVLDERGIITEANEALKILFTDGMKAVGQPFSSIIDEQERRNFIELLLSLSPEGVTETSLQISGKQFKAHIVSRPKDPSGRSADGQRYSSVLYLVDETAGVNLQRELGRTIDALRAENQTAEKLLSEEKRRSAEIVRNASIPILAVSGKNIEFASESAKRILGAYGGQPVEDFFSENNMSALSGPESGFEVTDSRGRAFAVSKWDNGKYFFYVFNDVTEFRTAEEEVEKSAIDYERLFNSLLPTALVKEESLTRWNDAFGSLFGDFLANDRSFDGLLRYFGDSPEVTKSELHYNNVVMRACRTTDRKSLNVSVAGAEGSFFVFVEDITEQENVKQQLRSTQNLLTASLESFSLEPTFIVENGIVAASNMAAKNKLHVKLDEAFNADSLFGGVSAANRNEPLEINGKFYRVETVALGSMNVCHLRLLNEEIAQRSEINRLKRRQETLRILTTSDRYESVLQSLNGILKDDGVESAKLVSTGVMLPAKETAEVYLLNVASEKIEPPLSLSLIPSDISAAKRGGAFSKDMAPNTTFMNVVCAGDSMLLIQGTTVGDVHGFASVALREGSASAQVLDELGKVLKTASSIAVEIHARLSAERKFEEGNRITNALVGLSGIEEGTFEEVSRKVIDLLRRVFGSESVAVYSAEGAALISLAMNGDLPSAVSIPNIKFGMLVPASQLEADRMKAAEGFYYAVRSARQNLALIFVFVGMAPAPSELSVVASIALDILESKRSAEDQSRVVAQLRDDSELMGEFMTGLAGAADSQDVIRVLGISLSHKNGNASVTVSTDEQTLSPAQPLEIVEKEEGEFAVYEVNLLNFDGGLIRAKCSRDKLSRSMVELAVDKIRSLLALRLPAAQNEVADLRSKFEKAKDDYAKLRESVDKIPASLRNARIEIDAVLSRLSFVQGDDRTIQEIKLRLASAAKEISVDLESSLRNQDEIFQAVRVAITEQESTASNVKKFDLIAPTEFRADPATFDLIKDLFVNFIITSEVRDCEVLMETLQPSPSEVAEGKGRHVSLRLKGNEGELLSDDVVRTSGSMRALVGKLEKMGYQVNITAQKSELTMDICEVKPFESTGQQFPSAILVEDDRKLVEEETQNLLQVFSRLRVAVDAVEAMKIFETEKFDAAFIDLSLPSINGRELCQQVKKSQPECVTVLLTNREGEEKSEGIDHIVLRPLEEKAIKNYIRK